jgi:integrase
MSTTLRTYGRDAMTKRRQTGALRRLPSGRWQVRVRDPRSGRLIALGTYATKTDARIAADTASTDVRRGAFIAPERSRARLVMICEEWLDTKAHVRPRTMESYRAVLETHVLPTLGELRLDEIDALTVKRWHSAMLANGSAPATAAKAYRVLRGVLQSAVDAGRITVNPAAVRGAATERPAKLRIPTASDVLAIGDAMPERYRALVLVAGFAGLRWGELAGLQRRDVDVLRRTVRVERQAVEMSGGAIHVGPPKSDAGVRVVAVPTQAMTALVEHLDRFVAPEAEALVFTSPQGRYLRRHNFRKGAWLPALTATGVEGVRFHDLRHLAGTLATAAGATNREVMARLGHASQQAAIRYQHVLEGRDDEVADGVSALIERMVAATPRSGVVRPLRGKASGS